MEDLCNQFLAAGEVVVEAAGLDPGKLCDVSEASICVTVLAENLRRGVEDALTSSLRLRQIGRCFLGTHLGILSPVRSADEHPVDFSNQK